MAFSPLDFWWEALLLASFVAYLPIPPLTWRLLENLHEPEAALMVPDILNTLLGIALVYCAILAPGPLHDTAWLLMAGGVGIIVTVLAFWFALYTRGTSTTSP